MNMIFKNKLLFTVILSAILFYVLIIFYIPNFITDDFYIFSEIVSNPSTPFFLNSNSYFFLMLRPIIYFSFWVDFHLFNVNAILMKFHSLIYLISSIALIWLIIKQLSILFNWSISKTLIVILLFYFILHFDNITSVYWISNRTEILALFFYLISFYLFLLGLTKNKILFIYFSIIVFIISGLTKQSVLHLPLIFFGLSIILKDNWKMFPPLKRRIIWTTLFLSMILLMLFNIIYSKHGSLIFLDYLWKKPFSIIGITLYTINPFLGDKIYNYFIFHKIYALFAGLIFVFSIIYLLKISNELKSFFIKILPFLIFSLISFIPRIAAVGGERLNTIQIFWMIILITTVWEEVKNNKIRKVLIVLVSAIMILNMFTSYFDLKKTDQIQKSTQERLVKLNEILNSRIVKILVAPKIMLIPYQLYYLRNNNFGKYNLSHTSFQYLSTNYLDEAESNIKLKCSYFKYGNYFEIKTNLDNIYLTIDKELENSVINTTESINGRKGFSLIDFKLTLKEDVKDWIYYDGQKWKRF